MNSFILGFHRLVCCPKWTPASRSSFRETLTLVDKQPPLTLAELEAATRSLLSVLLALLDPRVAGQETGLLQALAQLEVHHAERAGDAVAQGAGLGGHP